MARDPFDRIVIAAVITAGVVILAIFATLILSIWLDAADKRACRSHGGAVIHIAEHDEWRCQPGTMEPR